MELLSPAGNREALTAAISCGADAVYLGYTAFGARSYAGNFDEEGLKEAIEYAHERGKKIFVTVNTLVKECEIDDLCDVLDLLCKVNADAAIFQDLGAVRIARARYPQLALHASTQMTVNNAQGSRLLKEMGFARVVPSRECSLDELRRMADTGVEIEVFAHGALCVAVSGQCLFSSMIGGRSGNRGKCAQPCRLPYNLEGGKTGYLLSTRDLMLIDHLPQMRDAGVYSFKLEGRMKRPEYVGVITRAYREALDAAEAHVPYHPDAKTIEGLKQIFNRGGFTDGYVMGKSNAALMSWERPNHWGIRVGKVLGGRGNLAKVQLERDLHDGDGLQLRGRNEIDLTYSGNDMIKGSVTTVRIANGSAQPGDAVYRLTDAVQMKEIREIMSAERVQIPLTGILYAMPGEKPVLTLSDGEGHTVSVTGEQTVDAAQQRELDEQTAVKQLSKTGGTPYSLAGLSLESRGAFMTAGMLNSLRRDALEAMRHARIHREIVNSTAVCPNAPIPPAKRWLIAQGERLKDAKALLDAGADVFYWQPQCYRIDSLEREIAAADLSVRPMLVLPAVTYTQQLDALYAFVCNHQERIGGVVLHNVGQFERPWPVPVHGGQGLNVANSESARFYENLGAQMLSASCELTAKETRELMENGGCFDIEAYGRAQLMLLSHCPKRTLAGHEKQDAACNACTVHGGCPDVYTDRKGYRFPLRRLQMEHGCVLRVYNSVVTDIAKNAQRMQELACSFRLCFIDEPLARQKEIVASYRSMMDGGKAIHSIDSGATSGHWQRGVE